MERGQVQQKACSWTKSGCKEAEEPSTSQQRGFSRAMSSFMNAWVKVQFAIALDGVVDRAPRLRDCSFHRTGASFLHAALCCAFLAQQEIRPCEGEETAYAFLLGSRPTNFATNGGDTMLSVAFHGLSACLVLCITLRELRRGERDKNRSARFVRPRHSFHRFTSGHAPNGADERSTSVPRFALHSSWHAVTDFEHHGARFLAS